ncbi:hypothetical protein GCM10011583_05490 [Streptomyces camponoticapitis]|uniref:Uncharacterized protein n=1 Tax=Streptomyces camponoticapitis TaxID=1616125 RepID=A0ABQ2DZ84_9ACTN|nr:hypothetical protein [Streptomyces camponoticapitis]GGJ77086.1 hypothetical protein GCM10011583_05490 [Streptomyces camponoticapitis]
MPFQDENEANNYGLDRESDVRNRRNRRRPDAPLGMIDYIDKWFGEGNLRINSNRTNKSRLKSVIKP